MTDELIKPNSGAHRQYAILGRGAQQEPQSCTGEGQGKTKQGERAGPDQNGIHHSKISISGRS